MVDTIKQLCKNAGISLSVLEQELGLGKSTIYRWDTMPPAIDKVQRVADYFGVSTDFVTGREVTPSDETEAMLEYLHKNPDMRVLLSSSSKLEKEDLDAVVAIVKRMNRERDFD